ncbi:MarR family transcriptional regulator [Nodosilinea nodulosa]|uniref:MarR family transcriptional regulator n=1 Tax=Nodosilinea nodulosa TaxID=416001 RepID=UPI000377ED03|nr:helix-turn-helix domain-containing protein [Nodosilinea nodulosa]
MSHPAHGDPPAPRQQQSAGAGPKTMTDLLLLADPERTLVNWLVRQRGASIAEIAVHLGTEPTLVQALLDDLIAAGFVTVDLTSDPAVFKPNLISRKPRTVPDQLWKALD